MTKYLNFIKDKVQSKFISPYFDQNITLSGLYLEIGKTFICKFRSFGENNSSIMLQVFGYCFKQEMFKSFYLSLKSSLPLRKLRHNIYKFNKFYLDNNYSPHISLCYRNHRI